MENQQDKRGPRWGIIAAILVLWWLISLIGSGSSSNGSSASADYSSSPSKGYEAQKDSLSTPRADSFTSSTGAYMDAREKQIYERDPSSMGYTESDREFLREHGMTESEARAAETVLHQHGIDD